MGRRIVTARPAHLLSEDAYREVRLAHEMGREISDACALTVASWWQAPGGPELAFAELASTGSVEWDALARAIGAVYREADNSRDRLALDMLGTWGLNYGGVEI